MSYLDGDTIQVIEVMSDEVPEPPTSEQSTVDNQTKVHGSILKKLSPTWLPIIYALLGAAWILGSDYALGMLIEWSQWDVQYAQTIKGLVFVAITALSLYLIMAHYARRLTREAQAVVDAERSLRDFSDAATDWLWEMGPDMRINSISGRFTAITGDRPDAILGLSRDELIEMAVSKFAPRKDVSSTAQQPFRDLIYSYRNRAGRNFYFRLSGKPVFGHDGTFLGYRGAGSDVTREVELRMARDRLAEIIESTPDFVATAELSGKLLFINCGGRKLLGFGLNEDLTHLSMADLRPEGADTDFRKTILPAALEHGSWAGRTALRHRNGESKMVSIVLLLHTGATGDVDFLSMIARDLTEELQTEERLRRAQRMDALGQLTGGLAHDFNNLLMVMMGSAEALAERIPNDEEGQRLAESILQTGERGADLTHRLLSFSRKQALRPEPVDAWELVTAIEPLLRRTLGDRISVEAQAPEEIWTVLTDKTELETCLLNLALNARDAMPDGGKLSITLRNERVTGTGSGSIGDLPAGDYVAIDVTDTGTGIPAEILGRIFEPFFTTKGDLRGNGLGLSMVYGFARQTGGTISVSSEQNRGTTFRLILPSAHREAGAISSETDQSGLRDGAGATILVVEDDPLVRANLVAQLQHLGHRVHEADSGTEALARLESIPVLDLLLTDMVMPGGMNGQDVARKIQERRPGAAILFTTGYDDRSQVSPRDKDDETLCAPILYKPYRRPQLEQAVKEALGVGSS